MKHISIFLFAVFSSTCLFAQKETFDLSTFTVPDGWKKNTSNTNMVSYVIMNSQKGTYCQVGIYASTTSKGSLQDDFDSEWQELIVKPFHPATAPELSPSESADGWSVQIGAAPFDYNGAKSAAMLVTTSGFRRCMSIVVITNTDEYTSVVEKFLSSVDVAKPETTGEAKHEAQQTQSNAPINNVSIVGSWGKSNSVAQVNKRYGSYSYNKQQYTFNANGTYSFVGKNYSEQYDETLLIKETGTYSISNMMLIITPQTSVIEAWSKKDGGDNWKQLKTSQKRVLEKATYKFGVIDRSLVLETDRQTERDGRFSNGNTYVYGPPGTFTPVKLPGE